MWFIYKKFLKAKITNKTTKILIIGVFCLLPFGDRILANIEGYYYLFTTPKPKDDIEAKYPFSLYYNIEPIDSEKLYNLIRLTYRNGNIESSTMPFNLDGNFVNKIILNGSDGFLYMYSRNISGLYDDVKHYLLKSKEIENDFLKNGKDDLLEKYWALRDIEICKTVKHKIIDFFADYKNNEEIFSNIPATDYTFTNDIKEHFFVLVYDEKIIDNKTN